MNKFYNFTILYYITIYFSGAVATFSLPPFSILPLFLGIGFGIYLINFSSSLLKTFIAGWFLGFGWFSFGLYWIGSAFIVADTYHSYLLPIAIILLPSFLAFFWGGAFACAKFLSSKKRLYFLYIIVFLSLFEYLRATLFTGFPWLMPSMVFSSNLYLIQTFSFIGSFSTNLVVLAITILPLILFSSLRGKYFLLFILTTPIIILIICSFFRIHEKGYLSTNNLLITLIQPNIEQRNKWNLKKRNQNLNKLVKLSTQNREYFPDINRIIIWPETSFEGSVPTEKNLLSNITKTVLKNQKTTLILGLLRTDVNKIFNSLVFLNSHGQIIYNYDKLKLVPFGEYIPFRGYLSSISDFLPQKDFSSGKLKPNPSLKGLGEVITLICYEILFTDNIVKRISNNTNLLINITNDAWFGKTIGPYQHLALAKIKAVELGLPLARVANTGISAYVSPYGEIIGMIPLDNEGVKTFNSISPLKRTVYKTYGDYIFIVSILILLFINILYKFKYKEEE